MRSGIAACFLFLALATTPVFAGEVREVELKDGSVLTGEVLSLAKGIYTIKSDSLGTIKLEESKVRAIRSKSADSGSSPKSAGSLTGSDARGLQEKMTSDKEIMTMIQSLQNDPDFQKILEDPETVKAVQAGDVAALMANPQFMKLLHNSTVKDIEKKVK